MGWWLGGLAPFSVWWWRNDGAGSCRTEERDVEMGKKKTSGGRSNPDAKASSVGVIWTQEELHGRPRLSIEIKVTRSAIGPHYSLVLHLFLPPCPRNTPPVPNHATWKEFFLLRSDCAGVAWISTRSWIESFCWWATQTCSVCSQCFLWYFLSRDQPNPSHPWKDWAQLYSRHAWR
jgi:hypothetical protein